MQVTKSPVPRPDVTVEQHGKEFRISRKVKANEALDLKQLVKDHVVDGFTREGDEYVIYAPDAAAANRVADLKSVSLNAVWEKAKQILLPPNLEENVAPEYLKFRAWTLGSAVAAGAVGFANTSVVLNAMKVAFSSTEKAALAQTINTFVWRFSYMGGSFMAQNGDVDPRRFYTMSSLISSSTSLATLGVLSAMPHAFMPLSISTSVLGAVGSTLGGAASVNIFNHMARKNKGVVQAKNSNQDLMAAMLGMPVALGIKSVASRIGLNPALLTVATCAPIMVFCSLNAMSSIRMEPITRSELQKISDNYLAKGVIQAAPTHGWLQTLGACFHSPEDKDYSANIQVAKHLDELVGPGQDPKDLFNVYKDDKYLVTSNADGTKFTIGLKKESYIDDIFKAYTQARMMEQAGPKLYPVIQKLVGAEAAPLALAELTHRAINGQPIQAIRDLASQGWHASHLKMKLPTLDSDWSGTAGPDLPKVTVVELEQLIANPDESKLAKLLGKQTVNPTTPNS